MAINTWIYSLLSGQFIGGGPCDLPFDPLIQGVVTLGRNPNPRTERYDGAGGIRSATAQEMADYDSARQTGQAGDRVDDLALKGLAAFVVQELNVIRAALPVPLAPLTAPAARTFVLNFIKARL